MVDVAYRLDVRSQGASSGLTDLATGGDIYLFLVQDEVVGRTATDAAQAADGPIVFSLRVRRDGDIALEQWRAVTAPGILASPDLITLTAIVTGEAGIEDRAAAKIGGTLKFDVAAPQTFIERRRTPRQVSFDTVDSEHDNDDHVSGIVYELSLAAPGSETGLLDHATGEAIFLFSSGPEILARSGTNANLAADGEIVFVISVDGSGNVILDQRRDVAPTDEREAANRDASLRPDLIRLTARMGGSSTSFDAASANIAGALKFGGRGARAGISIGSALYFGDRPRSQAGTPMPGKTLSWPQHRQADKRESPHTIM
ncbi:DUF5801 repeats-in-toxin domain-containing protein [Dongia sp.]|uniref:DUF5801 repeats-in-toxin domain-containing protein n=1 Tax=Dongia sp. TaxID=1977262 RepID=UPI0035ADA731